MGGAEHQSADERARKGGTWKRALASAATGRVNLIVAGVAATAAAALQSLPILALGGAAYAALVAWDLVTPEHWRRAGRRPPPPPPEIPNPETLTDPLARQQARALLSTKRELAGLLERNAQRIATYLAGTLGSLAELEGRAARLVLRAEEISAYLAQSNAGEVRAEMDRLARQAEQTTDAQAREEFLSARHAKELHLATLEDLARVRDRVHANLARLCAAYGTLPARLVHMSALDAQAMDALSGDVNQELEQMNQEMATFEETLKNLAVRSEGT